LPVPQLAAIAAIIVELGGGILLVAGWKARWAAAAMLVFTGMAALLFHNFWAVPPDQAQNQMIHFMKNISMMGGLLFVVVYGSGPLSVGGQQQAC
jgi:putative oxidoreductase